MRSWYVSKVPVSSWSARGVMALLELICPHSPSVWDGNGISECFDNMFLGLGVNLLMSVGIIMLGLLVRKERGYHMRERHLSEKMFFHVIPVLGAILTSYDLLLLWNRRFGWKETPYYSWCFRISQLIAWMVVMFFLGATNWSSIFFNKVFCLCWIARIILEIPHLHATFLSLEPISCIRESCSLLMVIIFGIYINVSRFLKPVPRKRESSYLEDALIEEHQNTDTVQQRLFCKFWKILVFKHASSLMDIGVTKQLDFDDLIPIPSKLKPLSCHTTLLQCWIAEQCSYHSHPSLFRAIFRAYGWSYLRLGLLKIVNDSIGFMVPLLLNRLIRFLQQDSRRLDGYAFAVSLGLASIFKSFLDTQYTFHLSLLKLQLRSSIMTLVYRKCLYVNLASRSKFTEGEIQTFMSIDADRTVNLCNSFHDLWSLPLQLGIALYLLYTQVKFAFVSGLSITVLLIPVNKWISTLIANATEKMMKQKDGRLQKTSELLAFIQTLKMYGWEVLFANKIMDNRLLEVKHLSVRKYLDAWCVFFWATTPTLFSFFTFGLFTLTGHDLDAATVFTCVALFNTLVSPLNSFPWVINGMIDAIISSRRLGNFLACIEHSSQLSCPSDESMGVVFQDVSCSWSTCNEVIGVSILNNITLHLSKGTITVVLGEVGSGKSSLVNSILKETMLTYGSIQISGSIAYVSQIPWIMSGSVRDNILFGKELNVTRYNEVMRACALDYDISLMVGGDLAHIGEKGGNLSGGQRARLALARAVYSDSDIIILDDVLSAVDAQVANWIVENVILGSIMHKRSIILCTHNTQVISRADMVVVMDQGNVKWAGGRGEFYSCPYLLNPLTDQFQNRSQMSEITSLNKCDIKVEEEASSTSDNAHGIPETEQRKDGRVELKVYKSYAAFSGWEIVLLILLSAALMQSSRNGNDMWLSYWVDSTSRSKKAKNSTHFYLAILCIFSIANSLLTLARAFSFSYGGLRAAVEVHDKFLNKLIDAPTYFFHQNPSGRILNRFSSDLYMIDDSLPFILNILLANFFSLLGIAIVLSYVQVLFLVLLLPFGYIYKKLQFYYSCTSRELRRLDSVARSPIYASFTETLDGSPTIRAFNVKEYFESRFGELLTLYQHSSYSEMMASLWLSLRLQLLAAFVISFIAIIAVTGHLGKLPISLGTPGLVGLALSYATPIVTLLSNFLTSFTETEKEMVSVERVLQCMEIPQEDLQGNSLSPGWPLEGSIEFKNVTLRYTPMSPAALQNVSFHVPAGSQVGIIGRTGAGKSSLFNALFHISPICGGCILVAGLDVQNIAVRELRSRLSIVPQSPFLFDGLLRDNLDPFGATCDSRLWEILEKCSIKEAVEAAGGLDIHIKKSGASFSVGQRQLLCLARALLKSSKILCLDECTANVDNQTASILQHTISKECSGMTVLTIAHRISTVSEMDNILIFDHGSLVESGNPQNLLRDKQSRFSTFANASTVKWS